MGRCHLVTFCLIENISAFDIAYIRYLSLIINKVRTIYHLPYNHRRHFVLHKNYLLIRPPPLMTARRSFDVAGKIAFVLWRHGQRRNRTMPTMRAALLCLLLLGVPNSKQCRMAFLTRYSELASNRDWAAVSEHAGGAWIPHARSPSRIERSRNRLPVGCARNLLLAAKLG